MFNLYISEIKSDRRVCNIRHFEDRSLHYKVIVI